MSFHVTYTGDDAYSRLEAIPVAPESKLISLSCRDNCDLRIVFFTTLIDMSEIKTIRPQPVRVVIIVIMSWRLYPDLAVRIVLEE